MQKNLLILNNPEEINNYLLDQWITLSDKYIAENGFFSAAISGGKSPKSFYEILFNSKKNIQWEKIFIFLVDERYVEINHQDSNSGMIKTIIKNKPVNFFAITTEDNINKSTEDYEKTIQDFFNSKKTDNYSFDFILLGIGTDGHTASLFPGTNAININDKLITNVTIKGIKHSRISMTFKLLNNVKNVFFLATGEDKALILKEIIKENKNYPANNINPASGNIIYILDKNSSKYL